MGTGTASCVFGLTRWSLEGDDHLPWEEWRSDELPLLRCSSRARRFLIFLNNYRISRFIFIFPSDTNPSLIYGCLDSLVIAYAYFIPLFLL